MDRLLKNFDESGFRDLKLLEEMLKIDNATARYKLFTMFMTEIYSKLCGADNAEQIKQYLTTLEPSVTLSKF